MKRVVRFTPAERKRIFEHARALNTSQAELVRWCVLQGLDELDGYAAQAAAIRAFYAGSDPITRREGPLNRCHDESPSSP